MTPALKVFLWLFLTFFERTEALGSVFSWWFLGVFFGVIGAPVHKNGGGFGFLLEVV